MKIKITFACSLLIAVVFCSLVSCKDSEEKKVLTREVTFKKEGELQLKKAETDSIITSLDIEIAEGEYETQTGLMYRTSMLDNRGMLFIFPTEIVRSFYMKNTEFALDIIYISEAKKVVSIQKNATPLDPTSLPADAPTKYVLEVNAGLSDAWGLKAGDIVSWNRN